MKVCIISFTIRIMLVASSIMLTEHDNTVLATKDDAILARMWCELNSWQWPKELQDPEPYTKIFDLAIAQKIQNPRRSELMGEISKKLGLSEILKYWNGPWRKRIIANIRKEKRRNRGTNL